MRGITQALRGKMTVDMEELANVFMRRFAGRFCYSQKKFMWMVLSDDNKWRRISAFEHFLNKWTWDETGEHVHCGQSSPFKQKLQQEMIGNPRKSQWPNRDGESESIVLARLQNLH